jgi:FkbM family methyltransferase
MDSVEYQPSMLPEVVASGALADDPFVLVDVGCGLGIDPLWRLFEPYLHVEAFDPQVAEIDRLRAAETNEHVHYHAALVGLPDDDPFVTRRRTQEHRETSFNPWDRLSTAAAISAAKAKGDTDLEETNDWDLRELTTRRVGLADALSESGVASVDFVKTDTDGGDFEVLQSFESAIESSRVLGFVVETWYIGSDSDTAHTLHNVDRFMKRHRFMLHTLNVNRYSRAALPAPFTHRILAQTAWGQAIWGDVVYLRDAVVDAAGLSPTKLLKLACLCELFRSPDIAAEIFLAHRQALDPLVGVDRMLDLLTPPLHGERVSYSTYVAAFRADPTSFYPDASPPPSAQARVVGRTRAAVGRLRSRRSR